MSKYKVLMAPVNISGQPKMLTEGLQSLGVDARLFQYGKHKFGYASDIVVDIGQRNRTEAQLESLDNMLEMEFDIYHFWFRTFYFGSYYNGFPGFDLPLLKASGKKILYRFTGYDLRMASLEKAINPWHAYQYGFEPLFDEEEQLKYLNYLSAFVDQFIVQDIEMESYLLAAGLPKPKIVPRSIDVDEWPYVGVEETDRPLVIHAPSNSIVKGTPFILEAVKELQDEGLEFDFRLIQNMAHDEARAWYEKCDLAVDQILIGWYGVFSLECMALGKPVIVYIREDLVSKSKVDIPIINANPSNIKEVMRSAITDASLRKKYSLKQRAYAEQVHDVKVVAKRVREVYDEVYERPFKPAIPGVAIPHMKHQMRKLTDSANQKMFIMQKSGVSLNQDHIFFSLMKKIKQKKLGFSNGVRQKREFVDNLLKNILK